MFTRRASASPKKAAAVIVDLSTLQKRAMQDAAQAWAADLAAAGASDGLSRALARWIGLESSGNPRAVSKLGERGLLQTTQTTAKEGAMSAADWQATQDPATPRGEHARAALAQFHYHVNRAQKYVPGWPGDNTFDAVWYAKLHHQRPKDLTDAKGKLTGTAATDSRTLTALWKAKPDALKRLAAANVVAWGSVTPP